MEQKYRTLEAGEMLREGDEYFAVETNLWKPVRNFYSIDFADSYRRPVIEQEYRDLTFDDFIQPGDEVWAFDNGPWKPVSVSEHGQQYRRGYWRMRRPVAAEEPVLNGCGITAEEDAHPQTVASISTELAEVREAWQKDHMEMKRKLDAAVEERMDIERMWFDQRAELADAKNWITDLTRRLEDALSDRVIAEKKLKELERYVDEEHIASWVKIQEVLPESVEGSLVDQIIGYIRRLEQRISEHHKEAERLSVENEELCADRYQLNTIKQAFQFIKES